MGVYMHARSENDMAPEQVYSCGACWSPMALSLNSPNDKGWNASYFPEKTLGAMVHFMRGLGLRSPQEVGWNKFQSLFPDNTTNQTLSESHDSWSGLPYLLGFMMYSSHDFRFILLGDRFKWHHFQFRILNTHFAVHGLREVLHAVSEDDYSPRFGLSSQPTSPSQCTLHFPMKMQGTDLARICRLCPGQQGRRLRLAISRKRISWDHACCLWLVDGFDHVSHFWIQESWWSLWTRCWTRTLFSHWQPVVCRWACLLGRTSITTWTCAFKLAPTWKRRNGINIHLYTFSTSEWRLKPSEVDLNTMRIYRIIISFIFRTTLISKRSIIQVFAIKLFSMSPFWWRSHDCYTHPHERWIGPSTCGNEIFQVRNSDF